MKRGGRLRRKKRIRRIKLRRITNRELEEASKAVVFLRDDFTCVMCGDPTKPVQWSHVRSRARAKNIMYLSLNVKALCGGCHKFKWHDPPPGFDPLAWFRGKYPGRLEEIDRIFAERKGQKLDREATLRGLQDELRRLQGGRAA